MATRLPAWLTDLGHGVYAVDTGFERDCFDAAYLVIDAGQAAFIDTGPHPALPRLLGALDALGLTRSAVEYVIPTHAHLDHCGAAGGLMSALPRATLIAHPRAARHLIDPSDLWQGALEVYGPEEMVHAYGQAIGVVADRVQTSSDGMVLGLGQRTLHFADTPGHARHHHCIHDDATQGWFCGDTFGLSYPELETAQGRWIMPTSTPVQFEPDALRASVERLLASSPRCMYLTHFGRVEDVQRLGRLQLGVLQQMVELGHAERAAANRHEALKRGLLDIYAGSLAAHGCTWGRERIAALLTVDLELNAKGMACWLDREKRKAGR